MGVIVLLLIGGAFYGGTLYAKSQTKTMMADRQAQFANGGGGSGRMGAGARSVGGFVAGEIVSLDKQQFTIKLSDGGSKIVLFSDQTTITKSVAGALTDLVVGQQVTTQGTANADGSVAVQSIQIRPDIPNSTTFNP